MVYAFSRPKKNFPRRAKQVLTDEGKVTFDVFSCHGNGICCDAPLQLALKLNLLLKQFGDKLYQTSHKLVYYNHENSCGIQFYKNQPPLFRSKLTSN
jgi:hypothetical protein